MSLAPLAGIRHHVEQAGQFAVAHGHAAGHARASGIECQHRQDIHSQALQARLVLGDVLGAGLAHATDRRRKARGVHCPENQIAPGGQPGSERHAHDSGLFAKEVTPRRQFGIQGEIRTDGGQAQHHGQAMARVQR